MTLRRHHASPCSRRPRPPARCFEFSNLEIEGSGDSALTDLGLYAYNSFADLVIADSSITQTDGNPVLIEQHRGTVDIRDNVIAPLSTASGSSVFFMTYGDVDVLSRQRVRDNQISTRGVTFTGAFANIAGSGRFTAPEVTGNTISDIAAGSGVTLQNGDTDAGGAQGRIRDAPS